MAKFLLLYSKVQYVGVIILSKWQCLKNLGVVEKMSTFCYYIDWMDSTHKLVVDVLVVESLTEWMKLHDLLHVNHLSMSLDWSKMCCKMVEDRYGWPYPCRGWCDQRDACPLRTFGSLQTVLVKTSFIKCLW